MVDGGIDRVKLLIGQKDAWISTREQSEPCLDGGIDRLLINYAKLDTLEHAKSCPSNVGWWYSNYLWDRVLCC